MMQFEKDFLNDLEKYSIDFSNLNDEYVIEYENQKKAFENWLLQKNKMKDLLKSELANIKNKRFKTILDGYINSKKLKVHPNFDLDKFFYYIDCLCKVKQTKTILKLNIDYCRTIIRKIASEYLYMLNYIDITEQNKKDHLNNLKNEYNAKIIQSWNKVDEIESYSNKEFDFIISNIEKKVSGVVIKNG